MKLKFIVLKELSDEYRKTRNNATFEQIIVRVDRLLIRTINRMCAYNKTVKNADRQELYHTAILGLYRALMATPINYNGERLCQQIVSYVMAEIRKEYIVPAKQRARDIPLDTENLPEEIVTSGDDTFTNVEVSLLKDELDGLVERGLLRRQDVDLIYDYYGNGLTYSQLSDKYHSNKSNMARRVKSIVLIVRQSYGLNPDGTER